MIFLRLNIFLNISNQARASKSFQIKPSSVIIVIEMSRAAINISWNAFIVPCDTFHNNFLEIFLKASNFYSNICSILCRTDSFFRELVLSRIRNEMNLKIINETCWKIAINKFCIRKTSFQWFMLRNGRQNIKKNVFQVRNSLFQHPRCFREGKRKELWIMSF